jgi:mucin-19
MENTLGGTYTSSNPSIWSSFWGGGSNLSPIRLPAPLGSNVGFAVKFAGQIFSSTVGAQFAVGVDSVGTENINAVASDNANNMYLAGSYTNRGMNSRVYDAATTLSNYYAFSGINEVTSSQRQSLETLSSIATMCSDSNGNIYVGRLNIIMRVSPNGTVMNIAGNNSSPSSNIAFDGVGSNAGFNVVTAMCLDTDGNLLVTERHRIRRVTPNGVVTTVAGGFTEGFSDATGTNARFNFPQGICTDSNGNIYVADNTNQRIRRITPQGVVSTWAGQATWGDTDGVGTNAAFMAPFGLTIDTAGNLFVVEQSACRIRRITPSQVVSFIAGNPSILNSGTSFSDGVGSNARFHFPRNIIVDPNGTLYVADTTNNRIRRIVGSTVSTIAGNATGTNIDGMGTLSSLFAPDAMCFDINGNILFQDNLGNRIKSIELVGCIVNTFAGTGTATFANGTGITAAFNQPFSICTDSSGNVYVADRNNHRIRRITRSGVVSTFAGSGAAGFSDATGTNALFNLPNIVTIDRNNQNIYVAEIGSHQVRMITPGGTVSRIAGSTLSGFSDATGTNARFNTIAGMVVDAAGNIFVADTLNNRIRRITPAGVVTTFAGSSNSTSVNGTGTNASFWSPRGMCLDSSGNIFVTEQTCIRRITPDAVVTTFAGKNALSGYSDGIGTNAELGTGTPSITVDANGNFYITQPTSYHNIRKITSAGAVSTIVVSNFTGGYLDGRNNVARFNSPNGIWYDNVSGNLYIADTSNNRIRVIEPPMSTSTFVGNGISGSIDGIGTNALVNAPSGLSIDSSGNFIVVGGNMSMGYTVRRITPSGEISHIAGSTSFGATNGTGTNASFYLPTNSCVDSVGNIYVVDYLNNMIRRIAPNRTVTTFAGQINAGYSDAVGTNAAFNNPNGIDIDSSGNLYVTEQGGHRIRMITPSAVVSTIAGNGTAGFSNASGTSAQFNTPVGICVVPNSNPPILYVSDRNNNRIRMITSGVVSTFAGSGVSGSVDSNGTNAQFTVPGQITIDSFGNLYVGDAPRIRKITSSGLVTTIVGSATTTYMEGVGTNASFNNIAGLRIDTNGNLYVSDTSSHRIRMVSRVGIRTVSLNVSPNVTLPSSQIYTGLLSSTPYVTSAYSEVTTFAGSGAGSSGAIDGTGTNALFNTPTGVCIDSSGNAYVADRNNNIIRRITQTGIVSTFAGQTTAGFSDATGTNAMFNAPSGICIDTSGNLYVGDANNNRIRMITPTGVVSTIAGQTTAGFSDATGTNALFSAPRGICVDSSGNLYVGDTGNIRIRRITPARVVTTFAGQATSGFSDATGTNARFTTTENICVDSLDNIYVADLNNLRIRRITQAAVVSTFAGSGSVGNTDATGTNASFWNPAAVCADISGNIYVANRGFYNIRRITSTGVVTTLAGYLNSGLSQGTLDGVGTNAKFRTPVAVAVDNLGNLYVTDIGNHNIRRIELAGVSVSSYAGSGTATFTDENGILASFNNPFGICVDTNRTVYVADFNNHRIRRITASGQVTTLAGSRVSGFSDGLGTNARFNNPNGICIDSFGNLYVSDSGNNRIRKITSTGTVSTLAGSSTAGFSDASGTNALFNGLNGICVDSNGNVYVADYNNHRIRLITPSGTVRTYAGNGTATTANGTATNASFNTPIGVAIDSTGVIYVTEFIGRVIRRISTSQVVSTIAGSGATGSADGLGTNASFLDLFYCCTDASNNLLICDRNHRIRKISPSGVVSTLAGSGTATFLDGIGTSAGFNTPSALCVDLFGTIYVSDYSNHRIRTISSPMITTTFAGSGTATFVDATGISAGFNAINALSIDSSGNILVIEDGNSRPRRITPSRVVTSLASSSLSTGPSGIASDLNGNIFISDTGNHRIQRISSGGVVSTFAGAGFGGWLDQTGVNAQFNFPTGLAIDVSGNIFVADQINHRIRRITQAGVVTTVAGSGTQGFSDGVGTNAMFNQPYALCLDTIGNIYVADRGNHRIRRITPSGIVSTLAGSGTATFLDGIGTSAAFNLPQGIAIDSSGNLYVADRNTNRIRRITQSGVVTTIAGFGTLTYIDGIGTNSGLSAPIGMCVDNNDNLYVAANNRIRRISNLYNSSYFVDIGMSSSNTAAFAIKYDNLGKSQWSVTLDGASTDACMAMTTDNSQNVYLSGYYGPSRTLIYQNTSPSLVRLPSTFNNTQGAFCTKIDSSGAVQWSVTMDGANNEQALGTAVDSLGNMYITGSYGSNATMIYNANTSYSGIMLPAVSNLGCFLIKYNPSGNAEWANTVRGVSSNIGYSIVIDNADNIYVGGTYQGAVSPMIFAPNNTNRPFSLPAPTGNGGSNTSGFVVRYNTFGEPLNVWGITGTSNAGVYSVATDGIGNNIAIGGIFTGSANTTLLNTNSTNSSISLPSSVTTQAAYVARYNLSNVPLSLSSSSSNGHQKFVTNATNSNIVLNIMNSNNTVVNNSYTIGSGSNSLLQFFAGNWYRFI